MAKAASAAPKGDEEVTYTGKPRPCEINKQQEDLWNKTRVALVWYCPAFSHIFYTMLDKAGSKHIAVFTKDVPIAATDGKCLMLNPDTFFKYNLNERLFIVAHEIAHCIFNHCTQMYQFAMRGKVPYVDGVELPYNQQLMNIAADLVINDMLIESKIGQYNKDWLHDPKMATMNDSALDAYRKLYEDLKKKGKIKEIEVSGLGNGQGGFDEHMKPGTSEGKDAGQASQERNESEWKTQIAAAYNTAKAQGKLPASLERLFGEILNPQVDWREKIQALFARKVGSGSYDWRRADRRLIVRDIYSPGRSGFGAGTVVVGVDTSGSIGPKELDMFMAEMAGILEDVRPKRLCIVWCDAKVHRTDEAEDPQDLNTIRAKGAPGGGGTAFEPVFDWIAQQNISPDALVYLTDGMGSFPKEAPDYSVIWGNIHKGSQYPFGDVVDINV